MVSVPRIKNALVTHQVVTGIKKNRPTPYFLRNITICSNVAKKAVINGIEVSIECELRKAFDIIRSRSL